MEDAHIFDVKVWIPGADTTRPVEARLDERAIRVKIVDDRIGILLLRSSEDNDLEVLVSSLETLPSEGSDVDAS